MVSNENRAKLLGYSAGFALSSLLASATKLGLDSMVFKGALKKGQGMTGIIAIAILVVGTLAFGKMLTDKIEMGMTPEVEPADQSANE